MKLNPNELVSYFEPVVGQKPWRARLGWGSFLTLDFGPKVRKLNHVHGAWHLWIYQCEWKLSRERRCIVDSESPKRVIDLAVRSLERYPFSSVIFDPSSANTVFSFGKQIRLACSKYQDDGAGLEHDELWMLFLPDNSVLSVFPDKRITLEPAGMTSQVRAD